MVTIARTDGHRRRSTRSSNWGGRSVGLDHYHDQEGRPSRGRRWPRTCSMRCVPSINANPAPGGLGDPAVEMIIDESTAPGVTVR